MSIVLVDGIGVDVTLVTTDPPQPVQIVVTGLTAGQTVTVTGQTTAGYTWPVPGGVLVAAGEQVSVIDNRAPLNVPVRYLVVVDGTSILSDTVTVTFARGYLIQSLDGHTIVEFDWKDNGLPQEPTLRSVAFDVPGRSRPPVRFVPGGDGAGALAFTTTAPNTVALLALLKTGRPVLVRTDGTRRDFPPVELILPTGASNRLWGDADSAGLSTTRMWSLPFLWVDDPEPSTPVSAWTWNDFDAAMFGLTWDDFDDLFSASTWNDFDTYDWGQL